MEQPPIIVASTQRASMPRECATNVGRYGLRPLMATPYYNVGIISLSNASAAKTRWQGRVYYGRDEFGAVVNRLSGLLSFKPGPQWDFSISPNFLRAQTARQYFATLPDGRRLGGRATD